MQHLGITMDASPESAWRKSDNSRGLNTLILSSSSRRFGYGGDTGCKKEDNSRVVAARQNLKNQGGLSGVCREEVPVDPCLRSMGCDDVSLRQWLDKPERSVDKFECLHIFRQIVEIVSVAHSQGVVVHNVRPSCFVMSSFDHVSFIESASCSESGSDSSEDVMSSHIVQIKHGSLLKPVDMQQQQRSIFESEDFKSTPTDAISEVVSKQGSSLYSHVPLVKEAENRINDDKNSGEETLKQHFPMKQVLLMETSWYVSPEEAAGSSGSYASDVYRLGVILFELFCPFSSREDKIRIMASLKHRVLPPQLLLKWPKEASFCLWLLHPEPSSRPKMSELLESEFLNEIRDNLEEREASVKLREEIEEQDLLLEFLSLIQGRKQEAADKLQHSVSLVCSDIEEVRKRQLLLNRKEGSCAERMKSDFFTSGLPPMNIVTSDNSSGLGSRKRSRPDLRFCSLEEECDDNLNGIQNTELVATQESLLSKNSRLMKNFKKLESAYFLTRCRPTKPYGTQVTRNSPVSSDGKGSVFATERSSINNLAPKGQYAEDRRSGWITPFLEGLCKYLSFSKLEVRAELTQGDFLNSSNLVCALGFDRDGEFFATAGVNKKIKVFECDSIITERRDIHYPVVEMASKSKLSSICWNSYIKSQIASSNFEGVVQIWDVTSSQVLTEMREHERRVWSVDFSSADPTMLASGSDDGSVKLWSINQGASIGTIKTKANVCSVQFPSDSGRFLAFGSADHRVYYYDLRNAKLPLATLIGHNKTVSYVKFVDSTSLASASTDNTVKLWDLSVCTSRINDTPVQSFTGHMNIKNFVGLSVSNGYLATGSETNEVFIYHKAFPMPALSFKFNNTDPVSGLEMDDALQFVSSVCWRGQSSTLVAANSTGNIKILEMV